LLPDFQVALRAVVLLDPYPEPDLLELLFPPSWYRCPLLPLLPAPPPRRSWLRSPSSRLLALHVRFRLPAAEVPALFVAGAIFSIRFSAI
jgi:hypothetical protein